MTLVYIFYQVPLILAAFLQIDMINVAYLISGHDDVELFEWRRQWYWIDTKLYNKVKIASLKSEPMGKLINRIPGSRLLISSLPGSAPKTLVEPLGKPRDVNMRSRSLAW